MPTGILLMDRHRQLIMRHGLKAESLSKEKARTPTTGFSVVLVVVVVASLKDL